MAGVGNPVVNFKVHSVDPMGGGGGHIDWTIMNTKDSCREGWNCGLVFATSCLWI
jgi:hypothetical protein